jgi:hypothetical protein
MPTVHEVLKQSGFTDDQIAALDGRAVTAFSGVLNQAEQERQAAELARRSNADFYEQSIVPSLTAWEQDKQRIENERATLAAEAAFYRTQAEEAKKSGFITSEAPTYQNRDGQGRYVAGAPGATPGSPVFDVQQVYQRAGDAVGILTDIQWEHQRLFGQPMPISPTELVRRADAARLDPKTYASRTFNWDARQAEIAKKKQDDHDSKVRSEAVADRDRYWAERTGNNPDVRQVQDSRYSDLRRAVNTKDLPDPIMLSDQQRRAVTSQMIRKDISEQKD